MPNLMPFLSQNFLNNSYSVKTSKIQEIITGMMMKMMMKRLLSLFKQNTNVIWVNLSVQKLNRLVRYNMESLPYTATVWQLYYRPLWHRDAHAYKIVTYIILQYHLRMIRLYKYIMLFQLVMLLPLSQGIIKAGMGSSPMG